MHRVNGKERSIDALAARYFENETRRVHAPEPPEMLMKNGRRSPEHPFFLNGLLRAAAAAVCSASIALLPGLTRNSTPLREAVGRALREKTYLQNIPDIERLKTMIRESFERKETV